MNWQVILEQLVPLAFTALATVLTLALRKWLETSAGQRHKGTVAGLAEIAYYEVEQISRRTPNKIDDKLAAALKIVAEGLGGKLNKQDESVAVTKLRAMHEKKRLASLELDGAGMVQ